MSMFGLGRSREPRSPAPAPVPAEDREEKAKADTRQEIKSLREAMVGFNFPPKLKQAAQAVRDAQSSMAQNLDALKLKISDSIEAIVKANNLGDHLFVLAYHQAAAQVVSVLELEKAAATSANGELIKQAHKDLAQECAKFINSGPEGAKFLQLVDQYNKACGRWARLNQHCGVISLNGPDPEKQKQEAATLLQGILEGKPLFRYSDV